MRRCPTTFTDDLRLAHVLADDADSLSTNRFKALDLHVINKPDLTPVTDADKSVEEGIRRTLSRARPRDAVLGEEHGSTGHSQRRWVVDPIDGTKNYVRGVPVWATLIALMVDGEVVVGVRVRTPAAATLVGLEGRRRVDRPLAAQGVRVPRLRRRAARRRVAVLLLAQRAGTRDRLEAFMALARRCWRTRAYGDFWSYMLVAEGAVDLAAEPDLELYDMAALDVIVREAGGAFTLARRHARAPPAATRWPATAGCTSRRSRSSGRCPTTRTTPTCPSAARARVHDLSARRRPPEQSADHSEPAPRRRSRYGAASSPARSNHP